MEKIAPANGQSNMYVWSIPCVAGVPDDGWRTGLFPWPSKVRRTQAVADIFRRVRYYG